MKFEGGCYCRKIRYVADGEPRLKAQCHCRECQYITGGAPNMFMLVAPQGFRRGWTLLWGPGWLCRGTIKFAAIHLASWVRPEPETLS